MKSVYRNDSNIELYVTAEEVHFLAHAASGLVQRLEKYRPSDLGASQNCTVRLAKKHLQELSMSLREIEDRKSSAL